MNWKVISGLRFLLAWFIVCDHFKPFIVNPESDFLYKFRIFTPLGAVIGVLLISGYGIANSITKNPEGFYKRRIIRMYPLYFCAIILSLLPFLILGSKIKLLHGEEITQPDLGSVFGYLAFLQGFVVGPFSANTPLWPLGILSFAYLFTPLFNRVSSKILVFIISFSSLLYVVIPRVYNVLYSSKLPYYSYLRYGLTYCLFIWVWLLGFLYFREQGKKSANILLIGGCLMLILNQDRTGNVAVVMYLVTCLVLICSSSIKFPAFLLSILNYLGNIAYPFYLFHIPTFILSHTLLAINNSMALVLLALFVGMFFHHTIDVPLRPRKLVTQESGG